MRSARNCLVLLALISAACPRIDTNAGPIEVGPGGGLFVRDGVAIEFPAGAVVADTRVLVNVSDVDIPETPSRKRISFGFRFSPASLKLEKPVTVYVPVVRERLVPAVDIDSFDLRRQTPTSLSVELSNVKTLNREEGTVVQADSDSLGLFWATSPTEPNVERLELTPENNLIAIGETVQLTAQVIAPTGQSVAVQPTFSVAPARVGAVNSTGLFQAFAPGTATVTASFGSKSAAAIVSVRGKPQQVSAFVFENPWPTNSDLMDVAQMADGSTVMVGNAGTVLVSDGAAPVQQRYSASGLLLRAVEGPRADDFVAVGSLASPAGSVGALLQFKAGAIPQLQSYPTVDARVVAYNGQLGIAAGRGNDVLIFENGRWQTIASPSFETTLDVAIDGQGRLVNLGSLGSLYRYDTQAKVWDSLFDSRVPELLVAGVIVEGPAIEVWAVSAEQLWHFTAGAWSATPLPNDVLKEVTTLEVADGTVVVGGIGCERTGVVVLYDINAPSGGEVIPLPTFCPLEVSADGGLAGPQTPPPSPVTISGQWRVQVMRGAQVPRNISRQNKSSPARWLVGDWGAWWRWDSATLQFSERSKGFYDDVVQISANDFGVYVASNACLRPPCKSANGKASGYGRVQKRNEAGVFEILGDQRAFGSGPVFAVHAKNASEVLVGTSSNVFVFDGVLWKPIPLSLSGPVSSVQYCGDTLLIGTQQGQLYAGNTSLLRTVVSPTNGTVASIACVEGGELWVAGSQTIASSTLQSGMLTPWTRLTDDALPQREWTRAFSPGPQEVYAWGDSNYAARFDSKRLTAIQNFPLSIDIVNDVWGTRLDNLFVAGLGNTPPIGFVLQFDGVTWTSLSLPTSQTCRTISGDGKSLFLGTQGGGILRGTLTSPP
jgi:Bacterial Ig-like domain (group 2)